MKQKFLDVNQMFNFCLFCNMGTVQIVDCPNSLLGLHVPSFPYLNLTFALFLAQVEFLPMLMFRINHRVICVAIKPTGLLTRSSAQGLLLI